MLFSCWHVHISPTKPPDLLIISKCIQGVLKLFAPGSFGLIPPCAHGTGGILPRPRLRLSTDTGWSIGHVTHLSSLNLTVESCKRPFSGRRHSHAQAMSATAKEHSLDGSDFTTALGVTFCRFGGLTPGAAQMATHQKTTHATIAGLSSCCTSVRKVVSRSKFTEQISTPHAKQNFQMYFFPFANGGTNHVTLPMFHIARIVFTPSKSVQAQHRVCLCQRLCRCHSD